MRSKILLISDYDSRLSWGLGVVKIFSEIYDIDIFIINNYKHRIVKNNILYFNNIEDFEIYKNLNSYLIVVVALGGGANLKFNVIFREFCKIKTKPIIIMGFNGLVDDQDPHPLLCRVGADIICVNSKRNLDSFLKFSEYFEFNKKNLFLLGYVRDYMDFIPEREVDCIKNVAYIDQDLVYKTNAAREYVVLKLIDYAKKFKNRKIVIKLRRTLNSTDPKGNNKNIKYFFDKSKFDLPENIHFSNENPGELIDSSDLIIGFSSTMLIEAIIKKKKVAVLSDLGVSFSVGNHVFINSGLITSFKNLQLDLIPSLNKEWFDLNVTNYKDFEYRFFEEIQNKVKERDKGNSDFPSFIYSKEDFPFFYRFEKRIEKKNFNFKKLIQRSYEFFKKIP